MSLHDPHKGVLGAKRSSWARLHYRDLALKVCNDHPDAAVEELAEIFINELEKYPGYMESIGVYIMANVKASLTYTARGRRAPGSVEKTVVDYVADKAAARVLMSLTLPSGKALRDAFGSECTEAGGWLSKVGEVVGPLNIVGEKLTEADLQKLWKP